MTLQDIEIVRILFVGEEVFVNATMRFSQPMFKYKKLEEAVSKNLTAQQILDIIEEEEKDDMLCM